MSDSPKATNFDDANGDHRDKERDHSEERERRSRSRSSGRGDKRDTAMTQVYVAKLHRRTNEDDIRDAFSKYGRIKQIVVKHSYAFVDYENPEDASKAIREMDGKTFVNGEELVVE